MKRQSSDSQADSAPPPAKKRLVSLATFQEWKTELDKEYHTLSWLDCVTSGVGTKKSVVKLKCKVCVQFQAKIVGRRNYSDKWISGADSIRSSNIKDHSHSDQHAHAMMLLKRDQAKAGFLSLGLHGQILSLYEMSSFFLATQGWQKIIDEEEKFEVDDDDGSPCNQLQAINRLIKRFEVPLEAAGAEVGRVS